MNGIPDISALYGLLLAAGLGAFIGLRRDIATTEITRFAGLRSFLLVSVLGAVSTLVAIPYAIIGGFALVISLVVLAYYIGAARLNRPGITTELVLVLTYWVGVLSASGKPEIAIFLGVLLSLIQGFKTELYAFTGTLTKHEWNSALQVLILSGVVLPLLPQEAIDPWGIFNPFKIWLLVLLIVGIEFIGYFLLKYLKSKSSIPLLGTIGSLVSSTAVTTSMATQSKRGVSARTLAGTILLAQTVMQFRVAAEVIVLTDISFWKTFLIVPLSMALFSGLVAMYLLMAEKNIEQSHDEVPLTSPLQLKGALLFGLLFVCILAIVHLAQKYFGETGTYIAAAISGMVDIDAIVFSASENLNTGYLSPKVSGTVMAIALFVNSTIKLFYVRLMGTKELTQKVAFGILGGAIIGFMALLFWL